MINRVIRTMGAKSSQFRFGLVRRVSKGTRQGLHLPVPQLQTPIRPNYTSLAPLHQEPEEHGARRSSRNAPKLCRNANTHRHVRRALQNEERLLLSRALRRRVLGKKNGARGFGPGAKPRRQGNEVVVRRTEIVCKENQLLSPQPAEPIPEGFRG